MTGRIKAPDPRSSPDRETSREEQMYSFVFDIVGLVDMTWFLRCWWSVLGKPLLSVMEKYFLSLWCIYSYIHTNNTVHHSARKIIITVGLGYGIVWYNTIVYVFHAMYTTCRIAFIDVTSIGMVVGIKTLAVSYNCVVQMYVVKNVSGMPTPSR